MAPANDAVQVVDMEGVEVADLTRPQMTPGRQVEFASVTRVVLLVKHWMHFKNPNSIQPAPSMTANQSTQCLVLPITPTVPNGTVAPTAIQQQASSADATSGSSTVRPLLPPPASPSIPLLQRAKSALHSAVFDSIDPSRTFYYYWTFAIYLGFIYNSFMCVIFVFDDTSQGRFFHIWVGMNIAFDMLYLAEIVINAKLSHMEDGILIKSWRRLAKRYMKSTAFVLDVLAVLPTDLLLACFEHRYSLVRANRLFKAYRVWDFVERSSMRTKYPNAFRIFHIIVICLVIFHWNAALYFKISLFHKINSTDATAWEFNYVKNADPIFAVCSQEPVELEVCSYNESGRDLDERDRYVDDLSGYWTGEKVDKFFFSSFTKQYSLSIYWSSLTLTTSGQQPYPTEAMHNFLEIFDTIVGVLVFAVIVGSVGNVVTTMNRDRSEIQQLMDGLKFYMNYRHVAAEIEKRVMDCVSYIQQHAMLQDENSVLASVPQRLQAELAADLHIAALRRVELFAEVSASPLLYELVSQLHMEIYSPNDFLCRSGDIAKEMYVVRKGTLEVLSRSGQVMSVLGAGDSFGELSLLKVTLPPGSTGVAANRRRDSLRSIGYSEVYVLKQESALTLLADYPNEKRKLMSKAMRMLRLAEDDTVSTPDYPTLSALDQLADAQDTNEALRILQEAIAVMDKELNVLYDSFKTRRFRQMPL